MNQEPKPPVRCGVVVACEGRIPLEAEFRHRVRNRVVQAPIQGAEFIDGERRVTFEREVRDGLAEVSVVMDHLVY